MAAELVAQGPDLILVQTVPATRALMQAAKSIPIVMMGVGNPVELGIVADYRKPGGNVTGSNYLANEFAGKLLQLLKEISSNRDAIAGFAQIHGLPLVVVGGSRTLPASGLMAYGPTRDEYAHLAARYVDRILKGAKPGDHSIEQPTRFNLVINLKAAKALGLTIPQALLQRADEVIQ
jgi:ABC-type uncharacterized transport system substrate-binding protein